jgi:hypothetical protein
MIAAGQAETVGTAGYPRKRSSHEYRFPRPGQMGRVLASHVNAESVLFRGLNVDLPAARSHR